MCKRKSHPHLRDSQVARQMLKNNPSTRSGGTVRRPPHITSLFVRACGIEWRLRYRLRRAETVPRLCFKLLKKRNRIIDDWPILVDVNGIVGTSDNGADGRHDHLGGSRVLAGHRDSSVVAQRARYRQGQSARHRVLEKGRGGSSE